MQARRRTAAMLAVAVMALAGISVAGERSSVTATRGRELTRLVRDDCGACHGMQLNGGLGPPLTPQALREKPLDSLVATVLAGRPGTAMPPWRQFLSDADAAWIVARLREGSLDER